MTHASIETRRVRGIHGNHATLHLARWPLATSTVRIVALDPPTPIERWCRERAVADAVSGGFFTKPLIAPLGELVVDGRPRTGTPFPAPWDRIRPALAVDEHGRGLTIARRSSIAEPVRGSLLQAGPLLVADGRAVVLDDHADPDGFRSTRDQLDSDITAEPHPRVALARTHDDHLLAVAVDGRGPDDDGLLLSELAALLVEFDACDALNLDGGSSASLVVAGERRNAPRDDGGTLLVDGYPTTSAIVVEPNQSA